MRAKVIFFLQSCVGGAERVTVTIAKLLDLQSYDVVFCLLDRNIGNISIDSFIPNNYSIIKLPNVSGLRLLYEILKIIRLEKPDIVFSSMMYINTKILACSWLFPSIRFIVRNNNYLYTLTSIQRMIVAITYRFANKIIAQTDEMADELLSVLRINSNKIVTLHNPIDVDTITSKSQEKFEYQNKSSIKYVASGRFSYAKGFDILVKAFSIVSKQQPNSELYILGDNEGICRDYYNQVINIIHDLELESKVFCLGFQLNPYKYVNSSDCFVLSSRNEGLPNVLIEAQYLGVPVAATRCIPVIERIVDNGITGYLCDSEDPESLAVAMLKAPKLGRIKSAYHSASSLDFIDLFK